VISARLLGVVVLAGIAATAAAQTMASSTELKTEYPEGAAGETRRYHLEAAWDGGPLGPPDPGLCPTADKVVYRFSGVTDDGQQGSANRKEATSIHCTNLHSANVTIKVQVVQWNGTDYFEGCVEAAPPNHSLTFSTQNTTIYFDDVLLGGSPGTDAIFQGSGLVLIDQGSVICTAQVLDPLGYPPVFAARLPLWGPCGYENQIILKTSAVAGVQEFTACRQIVAEGAFRVETGGDVTLRTGGQIVFDDGFRVLTGATLTAVIDSTLPTE
jgi:hypothetical protein